MLGKIIDGRLVVAGRIVKDGNTTITNPTETQLINLGYKRLEYGAKQDYNDEEEKLVETYQDMGNEIYVGYDKVALTDEEHNAIIQQKIVAEENKITKRRQREIDLNIENAREFEQQVNNNIVALRTKFRPITQEEQQ